MLGDKIIRAALKEKLSRGSPIPRAIAEELRIHNGNAIADVVAIYQEAHCYEIKGDADKIERVLLQGKHYDLAFRKVTLVTTRRHLKKSFTYAPEHWGILEANYSEQKKAVTFKHIRAAQKNPYFNKHIALLTLWRNEMLDVLSSLKIHNIKKENRSQLTDIIAKEVGKKELSEIISTKLISRIYTDLII